VGDVLGFEVTEMNELFVSCFKFIGGEFAHQVVDFLGLVVDEEVLEMLLSLLSGGADEGGETARLGGAVLEVVDMVIYP
jgi:hypothetical protein